MASPEISLLTQSISTSMRNVLGNYVVDLEARYGDPRQYAKEREEKEEEEHREKEYQRNG